MRKLTVILGVVAIAAAAVSAANAQNLLTNGTLDDTVATEINPPAPGFFLPKPANWVNEGSRAITGPYEDEMASEPWAGPAPTPVTAEGNGLPGPDGCGEGNFDCAVFFKGFSGNTANGPATGHLYQDNPATPGLRYILSGWAGAEANFLASGAEIALEFLDAGGSVIPLSGQTIDLLPTLYVDNGEAFDYKQYTAVAIAPANAAEVRARASMIGGIPNPAGGGQAFVIDDFSLTAVPEPATALLVLFGAIGCGLIRRR
jgi:hypothetical protein